MPDTVTVPDVDAQPVVAARDRVDQLETELREAREDYYAKLAELTTRYPQHAVADRLGVSRQRVSELASRA